MSEINYHRHKNTGDRIPGILHIQIFVYPYGSLKKEMAVLISSFTERISAVEA